MDLLEKSNYSYYSMLQVTFDSSLYSLYKDLSFLKFLIIIFYHSLLFTDFFVAFVLFILILKILLTSFGIVLLNYLYFKDCWHYCFLRNVGELVAVKSVNDDHREVEVGN